jgi:hypothetical protein
MGNQEALRLVATGPEGADAGPESQPARPISRAGVELASERSLEIAEGGSGFTLRAPNGGVELQVRITPDGPVLCFSAAALEIERTRSLKVSVDRLELRAREKLELHSQGEFSQTVAGDCSLHCEGRQDVHAGELAVTSHKGPMTLESTHDLLINGERVLINC